MIDTVKFEIEVDGKIYGITQDPYCETNFLSYYQEPIYVATAIDGDDDEYEIRWEIINKDCEDESDTCDWENPYLIRKI